MRIRFLGGVFMIRFVAQGLDPESLDIGSVCFAISYPDDEMLIPIIETHVLVKRETAEDGTLTFTFQDPDSYCSGNNGDMVLCSTSVVRGMATLEGVIEELNHLKGLWTGKTHQ